MQRSRSAVRSWRGNSEDPLLFTGNQGLRGKVRDRLCGRTGRYCDFILDFDLPAVVESQIEMNFDRGSGWPRQDRVNRTLAPARRQRSNIPKTDQVASSRRRRETFCISKGSTALPAKYLSSSCLDTGPGSEKCHVRVDHRQPAHILEPAELTFKRLLHQYSKTSKFGDSRSVLDCSCEDARLVEMTAYQNTVLFRCAWVSTSGCEDHLADDSWNHPLQQAR